MRKHLNTRKVVFSCIGNISQERVEQMAKKYLEISPLRKSKLSRKRFSAYKPKEHILDRPVKQARCAIGRDAFPLKHENRIPFYILVNILGGPGMNSRLNLALREKHGYVYSVDALYVPYTDTGTFAVFFGTEPRHLDRCIALTRKELIRLCDKPLSQRQLSAAKEQIKGQLAMADENNLSLMMVMGRSVLDFGRVPALEEIFDKIQDTTSLKLLQVAQEMFEDKDLSCLIMKPN
jgi:predicted Zn-dependent peptidase